MSRLGLSGSPNEVRYVDIYSSHKRAAKLQLTIKKKITWRAQVSRLRLASKSFARISSPRRCEHLVQARWKGPTLLLAARFSSEVVVAGLLAVSATSEGD